MTTIETPPLLERKRSSRRKQAATAHIIESGSPHPLGARVDAEGVNFSVFSQHATGMELLLFDVHESTEPYQTIRLDRVANRTFCFWHCYVRGLRPGTHYAYRVDGPSDPASGHRFNRNKVLLDPYAFGNSNDLWVRTDACGPEDNLATSMRSVVIDVESYDWEGDRPINRPMRESIIYEMHVGGFTRSPSSGVSHPGTFRGVIEKIPYLKDLGVTAVELLPVMEYDENEILRSLPDGTQLKNFWGYSTVGFFAPASNYCVSAQTGRHLDEFRDMVKALHKAGIEVILDVVFNHTNEGNHLGPTMSFRGFDNSVYYHLVVGDRQYYMDYSGCGNTVNCNHPLVQKLIAECLEFWVREMHVDGFRFDEGSILSRDENGAPMEHPPIIWRIEFEEALADTKVIAEAWDAAGLYQIGYFPGMRWGEWNGRYRDSIRRFVAGQPGLVGEVATRIAGSADLYQNNGRAPANSVNFVTCHDGFTLNDLVSYDSKHNEANGEDNRDGINDNDSWNCGAEGETDDAAIEALRNRQVKNFAAILLLSEGVPMILGGDEIRRTQRGNNNAYCQDNETSWYDWRALPRHSGIYRFFQRMIAFRKRHMLLQRRSFFSGSLNDRGLADIAWHGCRLGAPGWDDPSSRVLSYTMGGEQNDEDLHVILNMSDETLAFDVPEVAGRSWYRSVDTSLAAPDDVLDPGSEPVVSSPSIDVSPRSVVVLVSR
jgi:isoamylase